MALPGQRSTAGTELPVLTTKRMKKRKRRMWRRRTMMKSKRRYGIYKASGVVKLPPSHVS
jgi:hypothetical protein